MKAVNVICAILAVLLSIVFVFMAISTVLTASVVAFVEPKNIVKLVQSIDYNELLTNMGQNIGGETESNEGSSEADTSVVGDTENEAETDINDENIAPDENEAPVVDSFLSLEGMEGTEGELINSIMQSNTVKDLVGEYAQGITSVFTGEETSEGLTADKLKDIANENMDEIVGIVKEHSDEDIDEDELRVQIEKLIDENADEIVSYLPSVEDVKKEMEDETLKMLGKIFKPTLTYVMIGITVLVALLIYACRFRRFGGFMWIGVDCIIASIFVGLISMAANIGEAVIIDLLEFDATIIRSVLGILTSTINTGLIVLVVSAVVCIAANIILKKTVVKKV